MEWGFIFFFNSVLLGVGLAMDAFSVSMANGLNESEMKKSRMCSIAGVFAGFQALMPLIGWFCVRTILQYFTVFERFIPWLAMFLLALIGGNMVMDGIKGKSGESGHELRFGTLLVQGVATSIDALSVGFTIADYAWLNALATAIIISTVTFVLCISGLVIGKRFGTKLSDKAQVFGGAILIVIGIEIFVAGIL